MSMQIFIIYLEIQNQRPIWTERICHHRRADSNVGDELSTDRWVEDITKYVRPPTSL